MANPSRSPAPASSWSACAPSPDATAGDPAAEARGRLPGLRPFAVIDIGSNSVRLVVYEGLSRSPTPLFNEKVMCALGRGVAETGRLDPGARDKALAAVTRFRALCDTLRAAQVRVIATAAAREASDGPAFLAEVGRLARVRPELLAGDREAELAALGVVAGFHAPDGVVGDLGGGSLEVVRVEGEAIGARASHPLGGLALMAAAGGSPRRAAKIVRDALDGSPALAAACGRVFYAVGGTFRALGRLHIRQRAYPLDVMHGYAIPTGEASEFARAVERAEAADLKSIEAVAAARRPLLAYGAVVLEEIIRLAKPREVVISASGVREGLLYEALPAPERAADPLLTAAGELNRLRSRAPAHAAELAAWADGLFATLPLDETADERRLRRAACLLSDIGWRAHPDYRGEQTLNVIAHAALTGIDHPGRAYLALAVYHRHAGLGDETPPPLKALATPRLLERARVLGGAFRVAYLVSAAMPGVLPRAPLTLEGGGLVLRLPPDLAALGGERLGARLKALAKLLAREGVVAAGS